MPDAYRLNKFARSQRTASSGLIGIRVLTSRFTFWHLVSLYPSQALSNIVGSALEESGHNGSHVGARPFLSASLTYE